MKLPHRYRTVFISDIHLGSAGSKVDAVQRFLASVECDHLYLVGDIIDGWVGTGAKKWNDGCTNVIRTVLAKAKDGCNVYYTPGNHDSFLRRINGSELDNIVLDHAFIHTTADGRDLMIVHGDLFDRSCTKYRPVAWIGAWAYEWVTILNARVNRRREIQERKPVNFAASLKFACKRFIKRGSSYETQLAEHAREYNCAGVVCGHIHRPAIVEMEGGFVYINAGDWVENCTAVVEDMSGQLHLLWWRDLEDSLEEEQGAIIHRLPFASVVGG